MKDVIFNGIIAVILALYLHVKVKE